MFLLTSAKMCGDPPAPPLGANATLVQSGSKYGPVCPEYSEPTVLNGNCPDIRCEIKPAISPHIRKKLINLAKIATKQLIGY